jgi:hypothetical protein
MTVDFTCHLRRVNMGLLVVEALAQRDTMEPALLQLIMGMEVLGYRKG